MSGLEPDLAKLTNAGLDGAFLLRAAEVQAKSIRLCWTPETGPLDKIDSAVTEFVYSEECNGKETESARSIRITAVTLCSYHFSRD